MTHSQELPALQLVTSGWRLPTAWWTQHYLFLIPKISAKMGFSAPREAVSTTGTHPLQDHPSLVVWGAPYYTAAHHPHGSSPLKASVKSPTIKSQSMLTAQDPSQMPQTSTTVQRHLRYFSKVTCSCSVIQMKLPWGRTPDSRVWMNPNDHPFQKILWSILALA